MKIFFGAAIQAHKNFGERADTYRYIIEILKENSVTVCTEHTGGKSRDEILTLMENAIGRTKLTGLERTIFVRNKMIEFVEGNISAAIFEVSTPSLGTGIELAHAYLRERMGLKPIPILALYEKDYWPNKLSSMILGLSKQVSPSFALAEYSNRKELTEIVLKFIKNLG